MNNTRSGNMRHVEEGYEADVFERWLCASRQGDQNIWAELEPGLSKIVRLHLTNKTHKI
jgi:hypothetical protein